MGLYVIVLDELLGCEGVFLLRKESSVWLLIRPPFKGGPNVGATLPEQSIWSFTGQVGVDFTVGVTESLLPKDVFQRSPIQD